MVSVSKTSPTVNQINNNTGNIQHTPQNNVGGIGLVNAEKQELCKKFNLTLDQYEQLVSEHPNFASISNLREQIDIVNRFKANQVKTPVADGSEPTTANSFDIDKYNIADFKEKNGIIQEELAHNFFIHGVKDKDGNVILKPSSEEAWKAMSDDDREAFITSFVDKIKQDEKLTRIRKSIANQTDEVQQTGLMDTFARSIQVANSLNMSLLEFMNLDEYKRMDATEAYLKNLQNEGVALNSTDRNYLAYQEEFKCTTTSVLKEKYGIELPQDISASELERYINDYNLNKLEEAYHHLSNEENVSPEEQKFLERITPFMEEPAGRDIINKANASHLLELQADFDQLTQRINAGEQLSSEEQSHYERLSQYLNSDDAKKLKEIAQRLPQPQNEYENSVVNDINEFRSSIKGYINVDELEGEAVIQFINQQIENKNMSADEKERYIKTFLTFNNDTTSVKILSHFGKDIKGLYNNKYLLSEGAMSIANGDASIKQIEEHIEARNNTAVNGNEYEKKLAYNSALATVGPNARKNLDNDSKLLLSKSNVDMTQYYTPEENDTLLCASADFDATISDVTQQAEAITYRQKSPAYSVTCAKHDIDILGDYHESNRLSALDGATANKPEATAYASENGAVIKLGKKDQTEGLKLLHTRVNEQFEGEDAIRYSNALADQIQYCDKDNQLAMHNEMMTSKYSEVQEHTAGNIKNYDPSVQPDAMSSVYSSGNQKAIDTAVASISEFKSPDVQQIAVKQAVMELASSKDADLSAKFANGTLTRDEISQLSTTERREYYYRLFEQASPADKIKYLKDIPAGKSKQTIYNVIGTYYKNLFVQMIQDDVQTAETMYNMGLKTQLHSIVETTIINRAETDPSFKFLRDRLNLSSEKEQPQVEKEYPPTAKTLNYTSIPNGLGKGFDSDEFALFKKDRYGNLLA